jgi:hypothetical protein
MRASIFISNEFTPEIHVFYSLIKQLRAVVAKNQAGKK